MEVGQDATTVEAGSQAAEPSAATQNTEAGAQPEAGHMIPKERFDEVNRKLRDLQRAQADSTKTQEEAQRKAAEEQGRYKELWEKSQADAAAAAQEAQAAKQETLRLRVVGKVPGFPAAWADRLRGETEDEMAEDAKTLMAAIPKPAAPNANGAPGDGAAPGSGQSWWAKAGYASKAEAAVRLNVSEKFLSD